MTNLLKSLAAMSKPDPSTEMILLLLMNPPTIMERGETRLMVTPTMDMKKSRREKYAKRATMLVPMWSFPIPT